MLDVCNYFAIENKDQFEIPFIGDISPDSPPDWLIGYPFIYNKNKFSRWSKLWNDFSEFDRLLKDIIFIRNNNDLASMKKNQWLKIINSNSDYLLIELFRFLTINPWMNLIPYQRWVIII